MKNRLQLFVRTFLLLVLGIHFLMEQSLAQFTGGDGSAANPWQNPNEIANQSQLPIVTLDPSRDQIDFGEVKIPTSVEGEISLPRQPQLNQNYPNPINPYTKIGFTIPEQTHVQITVYNAIGQKVATLVNGFRSAGRHEVKFDKEIISSGIFLYRMEAGEHVETKQMTLIK